MERTHLYNIDPICGPGDQLESLTGYFGRLASEHCVAADRLAQEVVNCCPEVGGGLLYRHFFVGEARSMDGMGQYARGVSSALETLTGRTDLRNLTMLRWSKVLDPRSRKLLRNSRAWCPECLFEQVSRGEPPYDRLMWRVKAVGWCGEHGRALVDACPSCGAKQPMISRFGLPGSCHLCGSFLGAPYPLSDIAEDSPNRRWLVGAIRDLLGRHGTRGPLPGPQAMLERLAVAWERDGKRSGLPKSEWKSLRWMLRQWQKGANRPMLGSLFRFAWATNTRPVWLLDGSGRMSESEQSTADLDVVRELSEHERVRRDHEQVRTEFARMRERGQSTADLDVVREFSRYRRVDRDHEQMQAALARMLEGKAQPVSVRDACGRLGVSEGYLAYRFPDELRALRESLHLLRDRRREQEERRRKARLVEIVKRLLRSGAIPSTELVAVVYHGDEKRRSSGSLNRLIREVLAQFGDR